jgi:hypothetical protein
MKVVINDCYGGFGLSDEGVARYAEIKGVTLDKDFYCRDIARDDPALVQLVEENRDEYKSRYASLKVVEIPDDAEWEIEEYDGNEWVAEKHRTWR